MQLSWGMWECGIVVGKVDAVVAVPFRVCLLLRVRRLGPKVTSVQKHSHKAEALK